MDAKRIKQLVDDFPQWKGDSYRLAALVAAEQKENDALLAEQAGAQEVADQIRTQ